MLNLAGLGVFKTDATALPNQINATLPTSSEYLISVLEERLKLPSFAGDHCVSLESSGNAWQTLTTTFTVQ